MVEVLLGEVGLGAESVLTLAYLKQHCYLCARAKEQNVGVSDKGVGLGLYPC